MPAFLVELPESHRFMSLVGAQDKLVVFAADVAGAKEAAQGHADGDGNTMWSSVATFTEIVVGTKLADSGAGWEAFVRLSGAAAQTADLFVQAKQFDITEAKHLSVDTVTLNDGGTATYVVDDILTALGGTVAPGGRAATFRVTSVSTGVIDGIELVDPGVYTVAPSLTANAVTGGGGTVALMDMTVDATGGYHAILARLVGLVNTHPNIANAAVDFSSGAAGARLFTVSSIADDVGDGTLVFEMRRNGSKFSPLVSTLVDEGIAAAVITAAIPASLVPPRVTGVKS